MSDIQILDSNKDDLKNDKSALEGLKKMDFSMDSINAYFLSMQTLQMKDKLVFFRLLATMINAGISILKALMILEKQEKNPILKSILSKFIVEIKAGKSFSECLSLYPGTFTNAEIGIIESGEKTGKLNTTLVELTEQVEKLDSITRKIKGAMIYPLMIISVVFSVVMIMMVVVVPKLLEIFGYDATLPLDDPTNVVAMAALPGTTKALIHISNFFTNYWSFILIFIIVFIIFVKIWKKTPSGMYNYDKIILDYVPIFGEINRKLILSSFARVLSSLLQAGVSIVESLRITSEAVGNEVYRQKVLFIRKDIQQGLKIYESLEGDPLFPDIMVQMIQVGEQTAKLDSIIVKIADFYDEEIDNTVSVINKLLEPIIIVVMAVMVGFIALAIMQPIMDLADKVSG